LALMGSNGFCIADAIQMPICPDPPVAARSGWADEGQPSEGPIISEN
jgi:hypothetical protein